MIPNHLDPKATIDFHQLSTTSGTSSKRAAMWLVAGVTLCCFLTLAALAKPPEGKGKPGGGDDPPSLPADLDVRYRVHYIPVPENNDYAEIRGINDVYESVGRLGIYVNGWAGAVETGFYYNAATREYLNANDMITLPERWVSTAFLDINNHGTIVGYAIDGVDANSIYKGIMIYPVGESYAYEFLPSPTDDATGYLASSINDFEDIVGAYWSGDGIYETASDAFAYNPGRSNEAEFLAMTPFGLPNFYLTTGTVTNARRGIVKSGFGNYWFDFSDAQTLYDEDPDNDVEPVSPVVVPEGWNVADQRGSTVSMSNDGQLAVTEKIFVSKKGWKTTYAYTPGVILDGQFIWQGDFNDGGSQAVNSASGGNIVGDVLGGSTSIRNWINHGDWGYLNLQSMLVFDSVADEERWEPDRVVATDMSDRDIVTGFGMIRGSVPQALFVLMPEVIAASP